MPKDQLLCDVRYFEAPTEILDSFPSYAGSLFDVPKAAISVGQRIGCKCQEVGVSIGPSSHLYIALVPTLRFGQTALSSHQAASWHRFVMCGLPLNFNDLPVEERLDVIINITFAAIRAVSEQHDLIASVEDAVRTHGESLEIVHRRKQTRRYSIEVVFTVAPFGRQSMMWLKIMDKIHGVAVETDRLPLRFYLDVFDLADRVSIKNADQLVIRPRPSFRASLTAAKYPPMTFDLTDLVDRGRATATFDGARE